MHAWRQFLSWTQVFKSSECGCLFLVSVIVRGLSSVGNQNGFLLSYRPKSNKVSWYGKFIYLLGFKMPILKPSITIIIEFKLVSNIYYFVVKVLISDRF